MQGEVLYGQLVLRNAKGDEKLRLPLTAPLNDLVGQLRPEGGESFTLYLYRRYTSNGVRVGAANQVAVQKDFADAILSAEKGQLAEKIAPYLATLRFAPDGTVTDVPDLPALAAWSLLESIRRRPLKLRTCPTCKGKWLGSADDSRYCQRVAPGQLSKDCRTLDYERRIAGDDAYQAYRREYKRLTEQERRGSLATRDLYRWREANNPIAWTPFDEWKARA